MRVALVILNCVAALVSAAWAVIALVRPSVLSGSEQPSSAENFYVRMYAARSIPLGLATSIMPFRAAGVPIAWLLFTAAAIQIADIVIGVEKKARGMMIGASLAASIHILCGLAVL